MSEDVPLFEQAVAALTQALTQALATTSGAERSLLLEEALRLHRLAMAQEQGSAGYSSVPR